MSSDSGNRGPSQGERVNRAIRDTASRLEEHAEQLVRYIDDEVVPAIRDHSSRALRVAATKLAEFADYMDEQSGSKSPPDGK